MGTSVSPWHQENISRNFPDVKVMLDHVVGRCRLTLSNPR